MISLVVHLTLALVFVVQTTINSADGIAPPSFKTNVTSFKLEINARRADIFCKVFSKVENEYWFTRNGHRIKKSKQYRYEKNRALRLKKVQWTDAGQYICYAKNAAGTVSRKITVSIFDPVLSKTKGDVAPVFRDQWEISNNFFLYHTGDKMKITCDAYGRPPPKIKWYKDDQLMRYTADGDPLTEHTMVLKFKDLKMKDEGFYKCFVWNRAGNISNTNQVDLQPLMITTPIPLPLENITVYEGDNATNICKAMCDYPPWFEWYIYVGKGKNKQRKSFWPDDNVDEYTWIGNTSRYMGINFRINNVTKEDERYYYCEIALNANGESYKESIFFYLHVLPKPVTTLPTTELLITTPIPLPLENITVYEGDNATNICKAMCDLPPWFEWYIYVGKGKNKQRKSFRPDDNVDEYTWIGNTPRYMGINFRINNVTKEDERYYYCEITLNANGESYKESIFFYLHVLPKPVTTLPTTAYSTKLPSFTTNITKVEVENESPKEKILCNVLSVEDNDYWFTRKGKRITKSKKYRYKKNRYLRIKKITWTDAGEYVCWARNKAGEVSRRINVVVVDSLVDKITEDLAPVFLFPKLIRKNYKYFPVGKRFSMNCEANGRPSPKVKWYKNGQLMSYMPDGKTPIANDTQVLIFDGVTPKDDGSYRCFVWNRVGNISTTYTVLAKEVFITKPIITHMKNITAYEGDNVKATCKAFGDSLPHFQWAVVEGENATVRVLDPNLSEDEFIWKGGHERYHGVHILFINVTKKDERYYYCVVSDNRGYDKTRFYLHVLPRPMTPVSTSANQTFSSTISILQQQPIEDESVTSSRISLYIVVSVAAVALVIGSIFAYLLIFKCKKHKKRVSSVAGYRPRNYPRKGRDLLSSTS